MQVWILFKCIKQYKICKFVGGCAEPLAKKIPFSSAKNIMHDIESNELMHFDLPFRTHSCLWPTISETVPICLETFHQCLLLK